MNMVVELLRICVTSLMSFSIAAAGMHFSDIINPKVYPDKKKIKIQRSITVLLLM